MYNQTSAVRKAVVPVAGLGTRFLPATKATPKEMLPVIDKPAIQYVIEEVAAAGIRDVLLITGRNKRAVEDHFDRSYELESALAAQGKQSALDLVRASSELAEIHYVRQGAPRGLGHAVLCAQRHVGDEPFAVLLGDDLIDQRDPLLEHMIKVREEFGGSVLGLMQVDPAAIHLYGAVRAHPVEVGRVPDIVRVTDLVEKPSAGSAPSNLAVIGRYVLSPEIFDVLRRTEPGRNDEIQLTDALREIATQPDRYGPLHGVIFDGRRYDTGNHADYLRSIVQLACEHDEVAADFRPWLRDFVAGLDKSEKGAG
ncbi:UTP--glucose-1-phosphate uridylyltransferase GalU [Streptomyces enissocaesilis]|uniref:UTP--glucose-1-phosphate uridylyltransferase n=1 Tax=Streptomyces enissocaesilis TaxID=332589 RepID=A0ABN3XNF2_9ACTN